MKNEKVYVIKKDTAVMLIDAQKGFTPLCPSELPVIGALAIVPECLKTFEKGRYKIGSKDAHNPNAVWIANEQQPQFTPLTHPNADLAWNQHCIAGTRGFEYMDGLPAEEDFDYFVWKGITNRLHPYSAVYHDLSKKMTTGVLEYAKVHEITTFIVIGVATDYCVLNTAMDLRTAGFEVILNLKACAGVAKDTTDKAIEDMMAAGIKIVDSAEDIVVVR